MTRFIKKILYPLQSDDIKKLSFILILTVVTAFFELLGIGLIIPILNIFVGNDFLKYTRYFDFFTDLNKEQILNIFLFSLVLIYFVKFFILRQLIYIQNEFSHKLFTNISKKIFKNYLFKNFSFHLNKNSSELIRNIQSEANLFSFGVVFPVVKFLSEILIFLSICVVLIIYEWQASIITILFMSIIGFILLRLTNEKLKKWGKKRQFHSALTLKQLQQSFLSIREIILNNLEKIFVEKYDFHNLENAKAGRNKDTITQLPRLILELIGVTVFLILIIFLLNRGKEISEIFVIIGVFFFASTRLLPSISKIAQSVQSIKFNSAVVDLIFKELKDSNINNRTQKSTTVDIAFEDIIFKNVNFSYPSTSKKILDDINIEIKKGDKIGIIGKTGSGKSTFLNLFTGLLEPQNGTIKVNNFEMKKDLSSWHKIIGYVPQSVSIVDESILFNIALEDNLEYVDLKRIEDVLKIVDLYEYIYSLPKNIMELAGENGKNFSGGQCQRLGIARALYKNSKVIVLDEATSALDEKTETKILEKLFNHSDYTIVTISHRQNSIKNCSKIYELIYGSLSKISLNKLND